LIYFKLLLLVMAKDTIVYFNLFWVHHASFASDDLCAFVHWRK
jgi:hypothetical protein